MMSGTSLDGVDAALICTDGEEINGFAQSISIPYSPAFRMQLHQLLQGEGDEVAIAHSLTQKHAEAVEALLKTSSVTREEVALIGFHGQTIWHKPHEGKTCQIGDAQWLATRTGIPVVYDFRSNDMAHGGHGAPLVPLYHAALAAKLNTPMAFVNIGGVANITAVMGDKLQVASGIESLSPATSHLPPIFAFDCGMGNALMDDWVHQHTGATFDENGTIAARGTVDVARVETALSHPFFRAAPPKSLDRMDFTLEMVRGLSLEDGAATLAAFTVGGIVRGLECLPEMPKQLLVTGGGRKNAHVMRLLGEGLQYPRHSSGSWNPDFLYHQGKVTPPPNLPHQGGGIRVQTVEAHGFNGDMLEAQAFGYLAARSVRGLPLSVPSTTGVTQPVSGGKLVLP